MRSVLTGKEPVDRVKELVLDEHEECGCECSPELASLCAGRHKSRPSLLQAKSLSGPSNWINLSTFSDEPFCTLRCSQLWMSPPLHIIRTSTSYGQLASLEILIFEQRKISESLYLLCIMRSDEFYCKVLSEEVICSGFERKSKYDFPGTAPPSQLRLHHNYCKRGDATSYKFLFSHFNFCWNGTETA